MTNPSSSVNLPNFTPSEKGGTRPQLPAQSQESAPRSPKDYSQKDYSPKDYSQKDYSQKDYSFEIAPKLPSTTRAIQTPLLPRASRPPMLPRQKRPAISSHRHDANPALAIKVLEDIQGAVEGWHQALRQTLLDIQAIYMEGPIVEGWLETVSPSGAAQGVDPSILRHADPQELTGYVDRICQAAAPTAGEGPSAPQPEPQYRLCSLNADGQLQCQLCPPDQLPFVSMAIARHQKLRQHLNQKQYLEARLKRAVEVLTQAREALDITPSPGMPGPQD